MDGGGSGKRRRGWDDGRPGPAAAEGGGLILQAILKRVEDLGRRMERLQLAEYLALFENPRRFLWINFLTGIARGLGIAVGFTLLGALSLYVLQRLMVLNLPVIGSFIAELVEIVQFRMKMTPGP